MSSRANHAFICTVVFIDIVEYSKKSVTDQMQIKEQFNALLALVLAGVPDNDRIILDTGDGAAISFLGDPEEGLYLGLALRDTLNKPGNDALRLRTGINLGPVRLVRDINGQPNVIGDGINVAQRVMSFADINQVLASRSYYEVISALSADYAHLFSFEGARTDKHVREHEVYALGRAPAPPRAPRAQPGSAAAAVNKLGAKANLARVQLMSRPPLATALTVALILGLSIVLRLALHPAAAPVDTTASVEPAAWPRAIPAKPPIASDSAPGHIADPAPSLAAKPAPNRPATTETPPPSKQAKAEPRVAETARTREPAPAVTPGTLRLTVSPWGEVHVDDIKYGVAPPLRDVALQPGRHKVEIRNPGFASYVQVVDVQAGEEIKIRHRFR